jgi:hypothetical protein
MNRDEISDRLLTSFLYISIGTAGAFLLACIVTAFGGVR